MIQLGCMTLPYDKLPFERALQGISNAGFKYVSFGLPHEGRNMPDEEDPQSVAHIRQLLNRYNLQPVTLISTKQFSPGESIERARARLETAQALGVKDVLSLGTWGYKRFPDEPLP